MIKHTSADSVPVVAHKTGVTQGRAKERALIVAWLRENWSDRCADLIEAGEHLK
jgi:hypothetical protein